MNRAQTHAHRHVGGRLILNVNEEGVKMRKSDDPMSILFAHYICEQPRMPPSWRRQLLTSEWRPCQLMQWRRNEFVSAAVPGAHVHCPARSAENFFVVPLHFFGSASTIRRFGKRFRDGQYSLVTFFAVLLLTVSPCLAIIKSGEGTCLALYME